MNLQKLIRRLFEAIFGAAQGAGALALSTPVQTTLVIVNVLIAHSVANKLRKARFAASVRVVQHLTKSGRREDLELILEQLPAWIQFADFEKAEAFQTFLTLLWPAFNTELCKLLKQQIEERLQEHSDFGHIIFTRLSFGRQPPNIVGIKAVPLTGEDILAMVLDLDVRWAGEPDVLLKLTKIGGATLSLHSVQIAGLLRVIISPMREEPPFITRISLSLLRRPYLDFSIKALGGPDLMSLPAISSWLHNAVSGLAAHTIVWPKQVAIDWGPKKDGEDNKEEGEGAGYITAPLGLLTIEVESGEIERRRSTFLGRFKMASTRLALVLPPDSGTSGVIQAGITPVRKQTLQPVWKQRFTFAVTSPTQTLRLLLSHQRLELLGADMPLGCAEISLADVLSESGSNPEANLGAFHSFRRQLFYTGRDFTEAAAPTPPPQLAPVIDDDDEMMVDAVEEFTPHQQRRVLSRTNTFYESASSGSELSESSCDLTRLLSAVGGHHWAVENSNSSDEDDVSSGAASSTGDWSPKAANGDSSPTVDFAASGFKRLGLNGGDASPQASATGADSSEANNNNMSEISFPSAAKTKPAPIPPIPPFEALRQSSVQFADGVAPSLSDDDEILADSPPVEPELVKKWLNQDGVWVDVPLTGSVTLAGMLAGALQPTNRPHDAGTTSMAEGGGWLGSLQQLLAPQDDEEEWDHHAATDARAGKLLVKLHWTPTAGAPQRVATPAGRRMRRTRTKTDREQTPGMSPGIPGALPQAAQPGVLAVRVAHTTLDYGQQLGNPVLAVGVIPKAPGASGVLAAEGRPSVLSRHRVLSMDCTTGVRPGLLHWAQVFYVPVSDAGSGARVLIELGNASSGLKLSSFGIPLYCLDSCESFDGNVAVEASAHVPLRDICAMGMLRGTWRLREARGLEADRLDVGRIALQLAWYPLTHS